MGYTFIPVASATAQRLRDDINNGRLPGRRVVLEEPCAPCRHCLQPGAVGDLMLLFEYQPFRGDSPYAVPSPIFLHAEPCPPYATGRDVPVVVRAGLRAVRAYDAADDLIDGDLIPGADIEGLICRFLENDRVAYLHVYSATAGCFTCRVDRS